MEKLISELESLKLSSAEFRTGSYNEGINAALRLLKSSLPTQQDKVVVPELPRHIKDYLKWCERNNKTLLEVIGGARWHDADYAFWTEEERRKIAVAYATGDYTVEKEQLYYVELPEKNTDTYNVYGLKKYSDGKINVGYYDKKDIGKSINSKLTEKEIKSVHENYWAFAVPVEEDE